MKMCIIRASLVSKSEWQQKEKRTRKEQQKVNTEENLMKVKDTSGEKEGTLDRERIQERKRGQRRFRLLQMASMSK